MEEKTEIILVRHGETDYNLNRIFQGSSNIPLNERGKKQAGYAWNALKDVRIDAAYASPLSRAFETCQIILGDRNIQPIPENGIREICVGKWEGVPIEDLMKNYPEQFNLWMNCPSKFSVEGSESLKQVSDRAVKSFYRIAEENRGKRVLMVSHMVALSTIMLNVAQIPLDELWNHGVINAGINVIEFKSNGRPEIKLWNGDDHIPEDERLKKPFEDEKKQG